MSRKNSGVNGVRLFDSDGSYQCHMTQEEADNKLATGSYEVAYDHRCGVYACDGCDKMVAIGIKRRSFHKPSDSSPVSLTLATMQALVGITRGDIGVPAKKSIVVAAEIKVRLWPKVGDPKAVRVRPRIPAEARA